MTKIFRILASYSPGLLVMIAVLSVIDGASNALVLGIVNGTLSGASTGLPSGPWVFFGLVGLVLVTGYVARAVAVFLATRSTYNLRLTLCLQILDLPLRDFERIGASRVLAVFTQDVATISKALVKIPELLVAVAIVAGCLLYLVVLAPLVFLAFLGLIVVLFGSYHLSMSRAEKMIARSREAFDRLLHQFQALANGFKELKLHASRRHTFLHEELEHAIRDVRQAAFAGLHAQNLAKSWGKVLYLVFIGLVLYGAGAVFDVTTTVLVAYVLTLLYMRESVTKILDVVPDLTEAKVALSKIERGGFSIGRLRDSRDRQLAIAAGVVPRVPVFETLALRGVTHRYFHETLDRDFTLGPLDFTVSRGELVYVVGGNGSGKTTLAKVLTGLYLPESGEVSFNGKAVSDANREEYRQLFTATFSDFHIFDRLLGLETAGLDERSRAYLTRLQLDHKVSIQDGVFSTTDLSRGQRKRLVLLTAYLEDRPIYVFDEWAADQDPMFKDVFYRELLPDLKRRQKAVVVISHDDRYYDLGDRVVKLEDGQVVADQAVHPVAATLAAGMRG